MKVLKLLLVMSLAFLVSCGDGDNKLTGSSSSTFTSPVGGSVFLSTPVVSRSCRVSFSVRSLFGPTSSRLTMNSALFLDSNRGTAQIEDCGVTVAANVPVGQRLVLTPSSFSGQLYLGYNARANLRSTISISGGQSAQKMRHFHGPIYSNYFFQFSDQRITSGCGPVVASIRLGLFASLDTNYSGNSFSIGTGQQDMFQARLESCNVANPAF